MKIEENSLNYSIGRGDATDSVFLDMNEGFRQWVTLDFSQHTHLNRYPDDVSQELRRALCDSYVTSFSPEQVMISAGSLELIDLIVRSFCKKGLLVNEPAYEVYETKATQNGIPVKKVLLNNDFSVNVAAIRELAPSVDALLLINPNNPTGSLVDPKAVEEILSFFTGMVIVDEAYIEFAGLQHSLASLVHHHPNVVVLRSFSKAWGLAGIRLGYALASPEIIARLEKLKSNWNVSVLSQEAGLQALRQREGLDAYVRECLESKRDLVERLRAHGLTVTDTHANFILVKLPESMDLQKHLKANGIVVRHKGHMPLLEDTIRISIGNTGDHQKLLDAVEAFYPQRKARVSRPSRDYAAAA